MINRSLMAYVFMAFLILWYAGIVVAVKLLNLDAVSTIGLSTAGGVFLGSFKDMWQFLWRTASPQEQALGSASTTSSTTTTVTPTLPKETYEEAVARIEAEVKKLVAGRAQPEPTTSTTP